MENIWQFKTARFTVTLSFEPEEVSPRDHFDDLLYEEIEEAIKSGRYLWFVACVKVYCDGREIAAEYLGACCYESAADFMSDLYFRDMVRAACRQARDTIYTAPKMRAA